LAVAALLLGVIALAVAIIGWFYPTTESGSSGHNKEEAKASLCQVSGTVREAVGRSTNVPPPENPVAALAVASNARLALYAGGGYLNERAAAESAAPKDLKDAVTAYGDTLQELSINYLAGASPTDSRQQPLRDKLNTEIEELNNLCR
jgi:hypothetical protein